MPPLLLHVGYHKTATTWLQRILFKPEFGYQPLLDLEEIHQLLERPHPLTFDAEATKAKIDALGGKAPGKVDVISSESLSGSPWYGGRESVEFAHRLKQVAPDARIVITIREQMRCLTSIYMQYILNFGTLTPRRFFADESLRDVHLFDSSHLEYHRLVGLYRELFGPENVYVTSQEALARDPVAFARDLARFTGASTDYDPKGLHARAEGQSYPEHCAPILRRINHFRVGYFGLEAFLDLGPVSNIAYRGVGWIARRWPLRRFLDRLTPITDHVASRFTGRYVESNRQLKAMLGDRIDLTGYEI